MQRAQKENSPKISETIKKLAIELNTNFSKEEDQIAKGRISHEKMLTIPGHKGNEN
jgi:hypothetical protein